MMRGHFCDFGPDAFYFDGALPRAGIFTMYIPMTNIVSIKISAQGYWGLWIHEASTCDQYAKRA
jgi:hypothetical protein